jgi:tetratricopeptide (TPR) repeat protein
MGSLVVLIDRAESQQMLEQSRKLYEALGDQLRTAWVQKELANCTRQGGEYPQAKSLFEDCLAIFKVEGTPAMVARIQMELGKINGHLGHVNEAEIQLREYLSWCRGTGSPYLVSDGLNWLSYVLRFTGKYEEMRDCLEESNNVLDTLESQGKLVVEKSATNFILAWSYVLLGRYEPVENLAQPWSDQTKGSAREGYADVINSYVALARGQSSRAMDLIGRGLAAYNRAGIQHRKTNALGPASLVALATGDRAEARRFLIESLRFASNASSFEAAVHSLVAAAMYQRDLGEQERAVELYAQAYTYPMVTNSRWFEDVAGRYIEETAGQFPDEIAEAARARGRERDLWETIEELLAELEAEEAQE